jgi:hypothetical protein
VRELKRTKPGAWGCVQVHEEWSTEEEAHSRRVHFWICKLGTFPGTMSCVEKKFELQIRKWEEYNGTRNPSAGSDDRKCSGGNARQLERTVQHGLPPHGSDVVSPGGRRTRRVTLRKFHGVGNSALLLSVENDNDFKSRCE